jgi:hypothetical protein
MRRKAGVLVGFLVLTAGIVAWAAGAGIAALWLFALAAVAFAATLPLPLAVVSPLFMGHFGWLVDMVPFVVLVGWGAVVIRWSATLIVERRLPRGGTWRWLPIGLAAWTALGILAPVERSQIDHFILLLGIQVVASATLLMVVDAISDIDGRVRVAAGLAVFTIVLSGGALLEWIGVPVQELQDASVSDRAEAAYGVDAFPNERGLIKYARTKDTGASELETRLADLRERHDGFPSSDVVPAPADTYGENKLLVRFDTSARSFEHILDDAGAVLVDDDAALAPANTIPRLRSFPRNALTYPGICAAVLPFAFALAWSQGRRAWLGRAAVAACLFGVAFALARGAWAVVVLGAVYLAVDGPINAARKVQVFAGITAAAAALVAVFVVGHGSDPLTARAGGEASIRTRGDLYRDTASAMDPRHLLVGYGVTLERESPQEAAQSGRYVPEAGTHSTYLNYLFRTGLPGMLAILAIYGLAAAHSRAAAHSDAREDRILMTAAAASVVAVGAHAVILNLYVEPLYTLTISLVLGIAMAGALGLPRSILPWRADRRRGERGAAIRS